MRGLRPFLRREVVVSADGFDVKGVLVEARGDVLVLRDAVSLDGNAETPVDGVLAINGARVLYVQVL